MPAVSTPLNPECGSTFSRMCTRRRGQAAPQSQSVAQRHMDRRKNGVAWGLPTGLSYSAVRGGLACRGRTDGNHRTWTSSAAAADRHTSKLEGKLIPGLTRSKWAHAWAWLQPACSPANANDVHIWRETTHERGYSSK